MANFDDFLGSKHIIEKTYDDGFKPVVSETGKTVALIPQTINAALLPLRKWILTREYNFKETQKLLEQKLSKVGAEHIVTPETYVAVPAIQALSYSMDSKELRNLYANLLARSMIDSEKDKVHPAFVEIIKQLNPDEAKLIKAFLTKDDYPLINVKRINKNGSFVYALYNFTSITDGICDRHSARDTREYIDNLCRLKIIEVPEGRRIAEREIYMPLETHDIVTTIMKEKLSEGKRWSIEQKKFEITSFGREFINICVRDL